MYNTKIFLIVGSKTLGIDLFCYLNKDGEWVIFTTQSLRPQLIHPLRQSFTGEPTKEQKHFIRKGLINLPIKVADSDDGKYYMPMESFTMNAKMKIPEHFYRQNSWSRKFNKPVDVYAYATKFKRKTPGLLMEIEKNKYELFKDWNPVPD